jgi:ABC-type polysaccharide/polyol phosphate export permease
MFNNKNNYINSLNNQILMCLYYWEMWFYPAWNDILKKYKRTKIGLGWNVLANLITILSLTIVWSFVFKIKIFELLPYMVNGFLIFFFFSNSVNNSCVLLSQLRTDIFQNLPIPFLSIILREISQQIFSYLHYLIIIILINLFFFDFNIFYLLLYFFGLIIFFLITVFICTILCIVSTRYRDIPPLVSSIVSVLPVLTPVIWKKEMLGNYENYIYFNPLSFMIEIVRDPIIGVLPKLDIYIYNLVFLLALYILANILIKYKGNRIVFWI